MQRSEDNLWTLLVPNVCVYHKSGSSRKPHFGLRVYGSTKKCVTNTHITSK